MLKGTVSFRAEIKGNGLTFPRVAWNPKEPGVDYTRLRNELAHKRAGVNLQDTKLGMANRLGGLVAVTKRAIELYS